MRIFKENLSLIKKFSHSEAISLYDDKNKIYIQNRVYFS